MINFNSSFRLFTSSLKIMQSAMEADTVSKEDVPQFVGGTSTFDSVMQILGLLVLFILIIAASYFATKWLGKVSAGNLQNRNISVVETFKISTTKYVQIIRVTDKYFAIGVSKDDITLLGEIDEEKIIKADKQFESVNFKELFDKTVSKYKKSK